jgi:hypothetical protein
MPGFAYGVLTGAAVAWASILFGVIVAASRRRRRRVKPQPPICGCEHHLAFHELADEGDPIGPCRKIVATYHGTECGCQRYTGPVPLPEFYAPEIKG